MVITSSAPGIPKIIKIEITSGLKGQPITIRNRNNGDEFHDALSIAVKYVFDVQNFPNNYTVGHVIEVTVAGEANGSGIVTTDGDAPQAITISTSTVNDAARGI